MLENYDPNVEDSMSLISNGKNDYLQKEVHYLFSFFLRITLVLSLSIVQLL